MTITVVFGVDDTITATLADSESADTCAVAVSSIPVLAALTGVESPDLAAVGAAVNLTTNTVTITGVESPDRCDMRALNQNSIIGHGKKFKIKPHDPKSIVVPQS